MTRTNDVARHAHIRQLLRSDFPPPADIVEFGAAPGDQIAALAADGYRTVALEIGIASDQWGSSSGVGMAELFRTTGVHSVQWDLETAPYPCEDASFEAVLMTEVYEHLREYPIQSLREARRVLKPGGRLYFTTPNAAYLMNRVRLMFGKSVATPLHDWIGGLPHARHAREYTFAEVRQLMELAGLTIVREQGRHFYAGSGSKLSKAGKRFINRAAHVRPTLGPSIVIVAERPRDPVIEGTA